MLSLLCCFRGVPLALPKLRYKTNKKILLLTAFLQGVMVTAILNILWLYVQESNIASDPVDHTRHLLSRGKSKAGTTFFLSYCA